MRERAKDAMGNTLVPIAGIVGSEITQIKDALEALTKSVTVSGYPHRYRGPGAKRVALMQPLAHCTQPHGHLAHHTRNGHAHNLRAVP